MFLHRLALLSAVLISCAFCQVSLSPGQVNMGALEGSTVPVVQTVTILTSGPSLSFEAAVRYFGSAAGWLSVSPVSGTTPATLTLTANTSMLPAATYTAQVTVDAGPLHIGAWTNVSFTVGSATSSTGLAVSPSSLTFVGSSL